ncbi:hypothetical protein, partial [Mesorhizobium sp. M0047]|uniref:hypothetical protein n=1 Tax=Mesorhizobium sp. M0047 TaxID=2956859 RepID=UPI00333632F9
MRYIKAVVALGSGPHKGLKSNAYLELLALVRFIKFVRPGEPMCLSSALFSLGFVEDADGLPRFFSPLSTRVSIPIVRRVALGTYPPYA